MIPTCVPTVIPTYVPSVIPTYVPSVIPTYVPIVIPTYVPSVLPTYIPSTQPSSQPSNKPSTQPSSQPMSQPTSQPSAQPSSQPTSLPTVFNIVAANLLTTTVTVEVVKTKMQYYIGAYIAYFTAIYVLLYLFASTKYGLSTVKSLYDSSYQSNVHQDYVIGNTEVHSTEAALQYLYISNQRILDQIAADSLRTRNGNKNDIMSVLINNCMQDNNAIYSNGYIAYVCDKRCLLGCKPILYPNGFQFNIPFLFQISLPPGRYEDWVLYVCNNHSFFSCFYYVNGHRLGTYVQSTIYYHVRHLITHSLLGAHGTKLMLICKDIVVFVLSQFSIMILQYTTLSLPGINIAVSLFIITPVSISIGIYYIHTTYQFPYLL